jgi:hypothetical protein
MFMEKHALWVFQLPMGFWVCGTKSSTRRSGFFGFKPMVFLQLDGFFGFVARPAVKYKSSGLLLRCPSLKLNSIDTANSLSSV